jgi:hypothetical protein
VEGYVYVNVDEGWLASREPQSLEMQENRSKFASGMRALGEWVHAQQVRGGAASPCKYSSSLPF